MFDLKVRPRYPTSLSTQRRRRRWLILSFAGQGEARKVGRVQGLERRGCPEEVRRGCQEAGCSVQVEWKLEGDTDVEEQRKTIITL